MKCIKCGKECTIVITPDLDVKGFSTCEEHKDELKIDLLIATLEEKGWQKFEKKYFKKNESNKKSN